jgi:thioredoxin-like negative regulator of GroEL
MVPLDLETRLIALGMVAAVALLIWLAVEARRRLTLARVRSTANGAPTLLYFSTQSCVQCRTRQWPAIEQAIASLEADVVVQKVDALAELELADTWGVLTVPTTVVLDPSGKARAVNYGLAEASKLTKQLAQAGARAVAAPAGTGRG